MALPLAPIAGVALRYGAVAIAGYAIARRAKTARRDQRAEDAFDETEEGFAWRRDGGQVNATGRVSRTVRIGQSGPGVEIDVTGWSRIKLRKV